MNKAKKTLLTLSLWSAMTLSAFAQGTAFTYQGQLNSGGSPANGSYDVQFTLFATNAGGSSSAGPVVKTGLGVTNGLFTTTVDFGSVFNGASNWLELAVRTNGASSFSPPLAPRQQLTPTPYAVYAETANASGLTGTLSGNGSGLTNVNATNLTGTVSAANLPADAALLDASQTFTGINNFNASVGIGTASPSTRLDIAGTGNSDDARLLVETTGGTLGPQLRLKRGGTGGDEWVFVTDGLANGPVNALQLVQSSAGSRMIVDTNGNFGLGTTAPANRLDVQGSADFTGNVGIGTTNPSSLLTVSNSSTPSIALIGSGGNGELDFGIAGFVTAFSTSATANDAVIRQSGKGNLYLQTGSGAAAIAITTSNNVGIGTATPNSDSQLQVKGMVRMGSETGTSEAPNKPIMLRRINSSSMAINQVVARSLTAAAGVITLERDGTPGGLVLKAAGSAGDAQIVGFGINTSNAIVPFQNIFYGGTSASTQVFTDAQKISYLRLSFGDAANKADFTTVELMRSVDNLGNNPANWIGTVTSTVNQ
ncbi:MAG TPA: hypothetical protein VFC44_01090 [Candidatus Saccharimonadales bacterium]|nr:hypothetical protein [Candidatus Saccharimonadales bacterium]